MNRFFSIIFSAAAIFCVIITLKYSTSKVDSYFMAGGAFIALSQVAISYPTISRKTTFLKRILPSALFSLIPTALVFLFNMGFAYARFNSYISYTGAQSLSSFLKSDMAYNVEHSPYRYLMLFGVTFLINLLMPSLLKLLNPIFGIIGKALCKVFHIEVSSEKVGSDYTLYKLIKCCENNRIGQNAITEYLSSMEGSVDDYRELVACLDCFKSELLYKAMFAKFSGKIPAEDSERYREEYKKNFGVTDKDIDDIAALENNEPKAE